MELNSCISYEAIVSQPVTICMAAHDRFALIAVTFSFQSFQKSNFRSSNPIFPALNSGLIPAFDWLS